MAINASGLPPELATLVLTHPPPFVYLNDPFSTAMTSEALVNLFTSSEIAFARVDAIACFSPRILFDTVLAGFRRHLPKEPTTQRVYDKFNTSMDSFLEGLAVLSASLSKRMFILVEHPERLKIEIMVPLTRLTEMVSTRSVEFSCVAY